MMKNITRSKIKAFIMALISFIAMTGLTNIGFVGNVVEFLQTLMGDFDKIWAIGGSIVALFVKYKTFKPVAIKHTTGHILFKNYQGSAGIKTAGSAEESLYAYAEKHNKNKAS